MKIFTNAAAIAPFIPALLFRRTADSERIFVEKPRDEEGAARFQKIRCPHCRWQPQDSSRWWCGDCAYPEFFFGGCGTAWNTFATDGKCPGCGHLWKWTLCLRCSRWARHEEWYENETD